ncbi:MAG: hypothetical protein KZQ83_15690 [gamma proteobacterium symbiont of Taylorina sp.]|nr:hypothetical protein [gamma proteobacterium symbiont of Taylorina sp.]
MEIALITPSYAPDYQRCKLLCQSIEKFVSHYKKHVIIVDRSDYDLFKSLENNKTEIICKEDILPYWLKKIPFSKWWFNFKGLPVRGWILQQIVKLSVHEFVDADIYVFADSDVTFIRPFDLSSTLNNDRVRLCSMPRKTDDYSNLRKQHWHLSAAKILGVTDSSQLSRDYISQLVFWRRDTLQQLTRLIETRSHQNWKKTLTNCVDFSEYTLYGIFCEHVLKEQSGHYREPEELCYCSWHQEINSTENLQTFLSHVPGQFNSVLIQSNLGIDADEYSNLLARLK